MSTFWMVLFVIAAVYLFGAAGWYGWQRHREFKQAWSELERDLDEV
jgi:hypothetical protein